MSITSKVIRKLHRIWSHDIPAGLNSNWFNPFATLYFNLVFFPFKQAIKFPMFVYGTPKLYCQMGNMVCEGMCHTGMIRFNSTIPFSPQAALGDSQIGISENGKIVFRGPCIIGTGNRILVGESGTLDLGKFTKIMSFCNITAYSRVVLGAYSWVVHRCQVLDTNFHFIANFNKGIIPDIMRPISIGEYCWICNSTTVSGGAVIPNKTIVASNSLVNKNMSDIPEESIIGGIPAKLIASGFRRVESHKLVGDLWMHYVVEGNEKNFKMPEMVEHTICDADYSIEVGHRF